ncbi:MAG: ROK family protein [Chthoniobacterales bacterium]
MATLFGIDLGGTKIEGAIMDSENLSEPLFRTRLPTESKLGYEHILSQIEKLCGEMTRVSGHPLPAQIGIGTPGVIDPQTGVLKNSNTQCLNGRALNLDLKDRLGVEFVTANDANCFALAEAVMGIAKDYPTVFGVILGTGVGGGLVVNGKVLNGCHGIAGEWGQLILDPAGPVSTYGTRGTVEAHICGPALQRFYEEATGNALTLQEIEALHKTGRDPAATATIKRLTDVFAKAISTVIDIFDPHAIVLGGGVGNIPDLYTEETREKIRSHIFNRTFEAALLKPSLGDSAGVFGAAMLVGD